MPEYNPQALSDAMGTFKRHLRNTDEGARVCKILENRKGGTMMNMECFTFGFEQESRGDFELLLQPPYIDSVKEAVSHISPNVKLRCRDFETGVEHEVLFEHTAEGIRVRRTPDDIRDI